VASTAGRVLQTALGLHDQAWPTLAATSDPLGTIDSK
jgi:hypothetical protein